MKIALVAAAAVALTLGLAGCGQTADNTRMSPKESLAFCISSAMTAIHIIDPQESKAAAKADATDECKDAATK